MKICTCINDSHITIIKLVIHFCIFDEKKQQINCCFLKKNFKSIQAKIAFLQGERKGQENLKHDLIRRIKMLEYALKQERYVRGENIFKAYRDNKL